MSGNDENGDWVNLLDAPLWVDAARDGGEWEFHLQAALRDQGTEYAGWSMRSSNDPPRVEYSVTGSTLTSKLIVRRVVDGFWLLVDTLGAPDPQEQMQKWADAAIEAQRRLGAAPETEFEWSAVVGPRHKALEEFRNTVGAPAQIGGLTIAPAEHSMHEWVQSPGPYMLQRVSFASAPVVVTGTSRGYNWTVAEASAYRDLYSLSLLLSVALGACWVARVAPTPMWMGRRTVPERLHELGLEGPPADMEVTAPIERQELPAWMSTAWDRLSDSGLLQNAATGYHQGVGAMESFPSLAMVSFVASIEAAGQLESPIERCPGCQTPQFERRCDRCNTPLGASQTYRRSLRLVLTEPEAKLLDSAYKQRSLTAHEGQVHGSEWMFGGFRWASVWAADPERSFDWDLLRRLRGAARALLIREMSKAAAPTVAG